MTVTTFLQRRVEGTPLVALCSLKTLVSSDCGMSTTDPSVWQIVEDPVGAGAGRLPAFLSRYIRAGDQVLVLKCGAALVLIRPRSGKPRDLLHARIGPVTRPKRQAQGGGWFVRASIETAAGLNSICLSGAAVVRYFYQPQGTSEGGNLYNELGAAADAPTSDLRFAWRLHGMSSAVANDNSRRGQAERAFNVLANPELRPRYDAFLTDADSMLPFPYGSCGEILVSGNLSMDESTFFADSILAFRPQMQSKKVKVLLRQCEFLPDRITLLDSRRKLEIWLDAGLLGGLTWDPTWNRWKQWLRSRLDVHATFVKSSKYRFVNGEWTIKTWWTALPARISVAFPAAIHEDIARAEAIHELLGRHAEILSRLREQVSRQPVEASVVQSWLDQLGAAAHLRPEYITWQPDYEESYFAHLRKRASTWFLLREEYLFVLPHAIVLETPSAGHASYIFGLPDNVEEFLRRYSAVSRNDIRQNKANIATELGFIGRVVRGTKRKRWLAELLKLAGEQANYLDAVED